MSLLLYAFLGLYLRGSARVPPTGYTPLMLYAMLMAAAPLAGASLGLGSLLARRGVRYPTALLLRLALAEAVGLFGFVLYFLGGPLEALIGFLGAGLLLDVIAMPTAAAISAYEGRARD
jgi:hypothetical protein